MGFAVKRRRSGIRRSFSQVPEPVHAGNLMESIHGMNIYAGFPFADYRCEIDGWGGDSPAFVELIKQTRPALIIEVGSWKGASAITMADAIASEGIDGKILCIDTWLGAVEFWMDQSDMTRFQSLNCRYGYPQVYYQFLANICHRRHQSRIVPFPIDSSSAALWLMAHGVTADLIYIDGSHEEEAVYQDLLDYSAVLKPGGRLFGDDWTWSGVRAAVEQFAKEEKRRIVHCHDKWVLEE